LELGERREEKKKGFGENCPETKNLPGRKKCPGKGGGNEAFPVKGGNALTR